MNKARYVAWSAAIFVLFVSVAPVSERVSILPSGSDKVVHALMYAGLALCFARAYPSLQASVLAIVLLCYGALIEFLQHFLPGRQGSVSDIAANLFGIVAALAFVKARRT